MRNISTLLSRIGQLLKTASPDVTDTEITVPNTYLGPLPYPEQIYNNTVQTFSDSFQFQSAITITNNAGGTNQNVGALASGVWELSWILDVEFNFANAVPGVVDALIRLVETSATAGIITLINVPAKISRNIIVMPAFRIVLPQTFNINITLQPNGVGQTSTSLFTLYGKRLL